MEHKGKNGDAADGQSEIQAETSQGLTLRAALKHIGRYQVAFELNDPNAVLRVSEVLHPFRLYLDGRLAYDGRAVVSSLVSIGTGLVVEATLAESGIDAALLAPGAGHDDIPVAFRNFLTRWQKLYRVLPEYKSAIGDLQSFLTDLRNWLQQVELVIRAAPAGDREQRTLEVMASLAPQTTPAIGALFERFEEVARQIEPELIRAHQIYGQRQLHPLLLSSPFVYRTFAKPLGHPGDYEMVNMMIRPPFEGGSLFARAINAYALELPPIRAHRNRLVALTNRLRDETARWHARGKPARVLNIGCGPAQEVQAFLRTVDWADHAEFTLLDFDEQALGFTVQAIDDAKRDGGRRTKITPVRKSVQSLLKQALGGSGPFPRGGYEFVYCAGLFDYLPDNICKRLMDYLYRLVAPGGLLMATNVDDHPSRGQMDYFLEWHLIYRDAAGMAKLTPEGAAPSEAKVVSDDTGVNLYLEARRPERE